MKTFIALIVSFLFISSLVPAQELAKAEFHVSGVCGMCKSRIEEAVNIKDVKGAVWDRKTKILKVEYYSGSIAADSLLKRIAAVGHDTEKYAAPDSVYADLPGCCHYRGSKSSR